MCVPYSERVKPLAHIFPSPFWSCEVLLGLQLGVTHHVLYSNLLRTDGDFIGVGLGKRWQPIVILQREAAMEASDIPAFLHIQFFFLTHILLALFLLLPFRFSF